MSKATDTNNVFGGIGFEHSYSSPSRKRSQAAAATSESTVTMRELCRRNAVSTVTSSSAVDTNTTGTDVDVSFDAVKTIDFGKSKFGTEN